MPSTNGHGNIEGAIGLDPSLTGFAVCVLTRDLTIAVMRRFTSPPAKGLVGRFERYRGLTREVLECMQPYWPSTVVIEGYSLGSMRHAAIGTLEFGGCFRRSLITHIGTLADPPLEAAPLTLKKFAVGTGGKKADKLAVALALQRTYGVTFASDDEFDAYALARLAACIAGWDTPRNAAQREAVEKVMEGYDA